MWKSDQNFENGPNSVKNSWFTDNWIFFMMKTLKNAQILWKSDQNCENGPNNVKNSWFTENRILFMVKTLKRLQKLWKNDQTVKTCQIILKILDLLKTEY